MLHKLVVSPTVLFILRQPWLGHDLSVVKLRDDAPVSAMAHMRLCCVHRLNTAIVIIIQSMTAHE